MRLNQRNASQNHRGVPSHTGHNGQVLKNLQGTDAGQGVEKREPPFSVGGNASWLATVETRAEGSSSGN